MQHVTLRILLCVTIVIEMRGDVAQRPVPWWQLVVLRRKQSISIERAIFDIKCTHRWSI